MTPSVFGRLGRRSDWTRDTANDLDYLIKRYPIMTPGSSGTWGLHTLLAMTMFGGLGGRIDNRFPLTILFSTAWALSDMTG